MHKQLLLLTILLGSRGLFAGPFVLPAAPTILDPREAFAPALVSAAGLLRLEWQIVPGYYLYRDKTEIHLVDKGHSSRLDPLFAPGDLIDDPEFGPQTVYRDATTMSLPLPKALVLIDPLSVRVTYQGCQEERLCYPPVTVFLSAPNSHNNH